MLVSSIYLYDLWDIVIDDKHRAIATKTHIRRYRQHHFHRFINRFFLFSFTPVNDVVKPTAVLLYTSQKICYKIGFKFLFFGHNDVMPRTGIESANLRSPGQCSNQLSYAAAKNNFKTRRRLKYVNMFPFMEKFASKPEFKFDRICLQR